MKKLLLIALVAIFGPSLSAQASLLTIHDMIGDNDGYGYGDAVVTDGSALPYTDDPYAGAGWDFDNRSAAELAATDGAQATDIEDNFDVTFFHTFDLSQFDYLTEAWFTIDIAGLQQGAFGGYSRLYLDGVEITDFLNIDQGAWGSGLLTYAVDPSYLIDGALDVYFYNWNGDDDDHIAIDFTRLDVTGETSVIPEPATILLFGIGLTGLGIRRFRK